MIQTEWRLHLMVKTQVRKYREILVLDTVEETQEARLVDCLGWRIYRSFDRSGDKWIEQRSFEEKVKLRNKIHQRQS